MPHTTPYALHAPADAGNPSREHAEKSYCAHLLLLCLRIVSAASSSVCRQSITRACGEIFKTDAAAATAVEASE